MKNNMDKEYIQITSGRGPVECCRVVVLVMSKIIEQARSLGYEVEVVEHEDGPNDGCMFSATLAIESEHAISLKDEWEGSVLWVAQKNPFRPWHRRKNWFVGVHFFKPLQTGTISERDITYETLRSSGPGGQNVNKVESAVRAIHVPTGITVLASDERLQIQNKRLARERLLMKLSAIDEDRRLHHNHEVWMNHNSLERGNPVQKFRGDL
jgi:peptide chain release factor